MIDIFNPGKKVAINFTSLGEVTEFLDWIAWEEQDVALVENFKSNKERHWYLYGDRLCYELEENTMGLSEFFNSRFRLQWCSTEYFREHGYEIIEIDDVQEFCNPLVASTELLDYMCKLKSKK